MYICVGCIYINKEKACTISKKIKKEKQLMIIIIIIEMNNKCGKRKKKTYNVRAHIIRIRRIRRKYNKKAAIINFNK